MSPPLIVGDDIGTMSCSELLSSNQGLQMSGLEEASDAKPLEVFPASSQGLHLALAPCVPIQFARLTELYIFTWLGMYHAWTQRCVRSLAPPESDQKTFR